MSEEVVLKVGSGSNTKRVAGAVCWRLRDEGVCYLRALKAEAVNTAVKAIAVANQKVAAADLVMAMDLSLVDPDQGKTRAIAFTVQASVMPRPEKMVEYRVSGKHETDDSAVSRLAGAVAAAIRQGDGARLRCIGAKAVYKAARAIVFGKGYLYANGITVESVPIWTTLDSDVSVLQIDVWGQETAPSVRSSR